MINVQHSLNCLLFGRTATIQDGLKGERLESVAETSIEFRLKLDPVKTQCMQESRQAFHQDENANGQHAPEGEHSPESDATAEAFHLQSDLQDHAPQDVSEF